MENNISGIIVFIAGLLIVLGLGFLWGNSSGCELKQSCINYCQLLNKSTPTDVEWDVDKHICKCLYIYPTPK